MDSSSPTSRHLVSSSQSFTQQPILTSMFTNLASGGGLDKQQWNALIGIITAIVGNILISFALNIQRYAHIRINREQKRLQGTELDGKPASSKSNDKRSDEETPLLNNGKGKGPSEAPDYTADRVQSDVEEDSESDSEHDESAKKSYLKSPWWWVGIVLMTVGEAGNFLAYGFAPASLVSPLGVVALISNCIIAPWLLKEKFRTRDGLGVLIAIGGVVTLVLSSEGQEKRMGPDDIWHEITRWEFELYLGITTVAILVLLWASERYGDRTLLIDLGLVGLFGGYTVLSTKGIASLLSGSLWKAATFPITYLLVLILVGTALMQIRYLNRALSRFDSTQVIPTQFVMFTLSVIVGSAVLYRDFESADAARFGKFIGGCALTFSGVYLITSGRNRDEGARRHESDDGDADEGVHVDDEEAGHRERISENDNASRRRSSNSGMLERMDSVRSQPARPHTPPDMILDAEVGRNPWTSESYTTAKRYHSYNTSSSAVTDAPETPFRTPGATPGATPTQRSFFTATPGSAHRHRPSIVDLFPGPISSTLSSSLSGVIADRRRELEASASQLRRIGLHKSRSSRLYTAADSVVEDGIQQRALLQIPVATTDEAVPCEAAMTSPTQRSRSMSFGATLSGLLGSARRKSRPENDISANRDGNANDV